MSTTKKLLTPAVEKMAGGEIHILCFGIPAGRKNTCPGATDGCESICYALKGRFTFKGVQNSFNERYIASQASDFVTRVQKEIDARKRKPDLIRIHTSGDFYSVGYARKWLALAKQNPSIVFLAYTRSWNAPRRQSAFYKAFSEMATLPNFSLLYSWDEVTGKPKANMIPAGVKLAYLQLGDTEMPSSHIAFRNHKDRKIPLKSIGDTRICVDEQREGFKVGCARCRICFKDELAYTTSLGEPQWV